LNEGDVFQYAEINKQLQYAWKGGIEILDLRFIINSMKQRADDANLRILSEFLNQPGEGI